MGSINFKPYSQPIKQLLSNKKVDLMLHLLLWVPSIAIPLVLMPLKDGDGISLDILAPHRCIFTFLQVILFYITVYYLYPRLFKKKRIKTYLLSITVYCLFIAFIGSWIHTLNEPLTQTTFWAGVSMKWLISMAVMGTGTTYMLISDVIKAQRVEQENLNTELGFLRSQVSPHFMFNTLNSMVSLARKKSDKLEPALMELSNLMHYMLYESDEEKVQLSKEITYIRSYIDLQTLRFGHNVRIEFKAEQPRKDFLISPMLLIPLIENAFKHGIGLIKDPEIIIELNGGKDFIQLRVRNKYNTDSVEVKDKTSGIGLANLDRRLKLLYPNEHLLEITRGGSYFIAFLKINLHDQVHCGG